VLSSLPSRMAYPTSFSWICLHRSSGCKAARAKWDRSDSLHDIHEKVNNITLLTNITLFTEIIHSMPISLGSGDFKIVPLSLSIKIG